MPALTQEQRRAETRRRLLDAARVVVADRGLAAASVDAVAEAAGRTSGALYDHFGGKAGLLFALLDEWKEATARAIVADLASTEDGRGRLASMWRNFAEPPAEAGGDWTLLEHELWLHACRQPDLTPVAAERYAGIRRRLGAAIQSGVLGYGQEMNVAEGQDAATLLIALMVGLEMQRRLDPDAVSDDLAVAGLESLTGTA